MICITQLSKIDELISNTDNPSTSRSNFEVFVAFKNSFGAYNRKDV